MDNYHWITGAVGYSNIKWLSIVTRQTPEPNR